MSKKDLNDMSPFEQARWYALVEAVNIIADECEKRGKNFNKMKVSPLDLEKYIEGTCDIFTRKIEAEREQARANAITLQLHGQTVTLQEA